MKTNLLKEYRKAKKSGWKYSPELEPIQREKMRVGRFYSDAGGPLDEINTIFKIESISPEKDEIKAIRYEGNVQYPETTLFYFHGSPFYQLKKTTL